MTKYREYVEKMLASDPELFKKFDLVHAQYHLEPDKYSSEFNQLGEEVLDLVREYENRLCSKSEGSGYASYSSHLAEKFQEEVRILFPLIDKVGVVVKEKPRPEKAFVIKRIHLT
jgi:hypothetical protein